MAPTFQQLQQQSFFQRQRQAQQQAVQLQQQAQDNAQVDQNTGNARAQEQGALDAALRLYNKGYKNFREVTDPRIKFYLTRLVKGEQPAIDQAINSIQSQTSMSLTPEVKQQIASQVRAAYGGNISSDQLNANINKDLGRTPQPQFQSLSSDNQIMSPVKQNPVPFQQIASPVVNPPKQSILTLGTNLIKGLYEAQIGALATAPTKSDYQALFFTPALATGSFSESADAAFSSTPRPRLRVNAITGQVEVIPDAEAIKAGLQEKALTDPNAFRENIRALVQKNLDNPTQLRNIQNLLESSLGQQGKLLVKDLIVQEQAALPEIVKPVKPTIQYKGQVGDISGSSIFTSKTSGYQSPYYGKGQYEKTNFVATSNPSRNQQSNAMNFNNVLNLGNSQGSTNLLNNKQSVLNPQRQNQPQQPKTQQRIGLGLGLSQPQQQQPRQQQQQRNVLNMAQPQVPKQGTPQKQVPKTGLGFPLPKRNKVKNESILTSGDRQAYNVLVGRGKKQKVIARGLPFGRAEKRGAEYNLGNITASFKLQAAGTTSLQDINYKLPSIFQASKREAGRIVQIARTRLSAYGEKTDILSAKRRKGKAIKWL